VRDRRQDGTLHSDSDLTSHLLHRHHLARQRKLWALWESPAFYYSHNEDDNERLGDICDELYSQLEEAGGLPAPLSQFKPMTITVPDTSLPRGPNMAIVLMHHTLNPTSSRDHMRCLTEYEQLRDHATYFRSLRRKELCKRKREAKGDGKAVKLNGKTDWDAYHDCFKKHAATHTVQSYPVAWKHCIKHCAFGLTNPA
jgi:hypothetical protein